MNNKASRTPKHLANLQVVDHAANYGYSDLFFSVTDTTGKIKYGNETFFRIAEFAEAETVGKQHNIVRHPAMPRAVFRLLWQYLDANKGIAAYVINRTKSGKYYWVFGVFTPVVNEKGEITDHLSCRIKPSSPRLAQIQGVYAKMLEIESESGMDESTAYLIDVLGQLGYSSYDEFMHQSLSMEMKTYLDTRVFVSNIAVRRGDRSDMGLVHRSLCKNIPFLDNCARALNDAGAIILNLRKLLASTLDFYTLTKDSSMNVAIAAGKLGGQASRSLNPIVFELIEISTTGEAAVAEFESTLNEIMLAHGGLAYRMQKTLLYSSILLEFFDDILSQENSANEEAKQRLYAVAGMFVRIMLQDLREIEGMVSDFSMNVRGVFDMIGRKLGYSMLIGRTLCAQGIVQAEVWNADSLVNTLTDLQKEVGAFELCLDESAAGFGKMEQVLSYVDRAFTKCLETNEQVDELLA
ncbi:MAG: PAS domain-containing protein [Mariprofundales bacterium]|nr:PAS domain-containing protein [Mariprofundales bacterium]